MTGDGLLDQLDQGLAAAWQETACCQAIRDKACLCSRPAAMRPEVSLAGQR
jgi:hypothetical protein